MAWAMACLPWRRVGWRFYRAPLLVCLAMSVLALLSWAGLNALDAPAQAATAGAAVLSLLGYVAWSLERPRAGLVFLVWIGLAAAVAAVLRASGAGGTIHPAWTLNALGALASGALMGSVMVGMLLGHSYLIHPAMSIDPLRRVLVLVATSIVVRGAVAALGLAAWHSRGAPADLPSAGSVPMLIWIVRWALGLAIPLVLTGLTWQTLKIRSTQSATGILYAGVILVLLGEVTALVLGRHLGMPV